MLELPQFYAITGEMGDAKSWWDRFGVLANKPDLFIQLRCKQLTSAQLNNIAARAAEICRASGTLLLLNGPVELVKDLRMDGVHLSSAALMGLKRRPLPPGYLVGASCHDERELRHAESLGSDFACLSPVRATSSHPGARTLGMDGFASLAGVAAIPVFALGGMYREDLSAVRQAGAYGVAGISAFRA